MPSLVCSAALLSSATYFTFDIQHHSTLVPGSDPGNFTNDFLTNVEMGQNGTYYVDFVSTAHGVITRVYILIIFGKWGWK